MSLIEQVRPQLPDNALDNLHRADSMWHRYKHDERSVPQVVDNAKEPLDAIDWDVVICGGTLGILLGSALVRQGWRVAILEKGSLRGRDQEWNISRRELDVFIELNILTHDELNRAIATEYNPARIAFHEGVELWVNDVLNIGVDPVYLLDTLKSKFLDAGGMLFEETPFAGATVYPNGVHIDAGQGFTTRLVVDAMGHFSPIAQQARGGEKPDAVCMVVGSCAQGFPDNSTGDLFASITPIEHQCQYFWEAFPARDGRTTYLFTYLDAHPQRPNLEDLFEEYLRLLPTYQGVDLAQLDFKRVLFGFFPCYRHSPLQLPWDRVLAIGDSSGSQSPLSFGGFGAMIRHLKRLTYGVHDALQTDQLNQGALALLQPYQPNLSVTWLFQRAMSVGVNQTVDPNQINHLLSDVFQDMHELGDRVLKPFLQDVVQFSGLFQTLTRTSIKHPGIVLKIIPRIGLPTLLNWMLHYANLGAYTALSALGKSAYPLIKTLPPAQAYYLHRWIDAWRYGSGDDYES
ncbi:MAG: FAD-dependent oxidoreductase [Elainellaceae cyanobacterium]